MKVCPRILRAFALVTALGLSGCASVTVSELGGHTMVDIENTNWQFLSFIPLGSGEPERPNEMSCRLFSNSATLESNMYMLSNVIIDEGADHARSIVSHTSDEKVLFFLFRRYAFHTSAELVKEPAVEPAAEPAAAESDPAYSITEKDLCELLNM